MKVGEVRIIDGRLSLIVEGAPYPVNFWAWRTVRKDGSLGKRYSSYNNGTIKMSKPIEHEVVIKVNSFDLLKVEVKDEN